MKLLLEMGADVNNRNRQGVPNLVHACATSEENEEFCIDLIRAGADVRLVDEVKRRRFAFVRSFIAFSKLFRKRNERRCTTRVSRATPKSFANFSERKPIRTPWTVKNRRRCTKRRKADTSRRSKFSPVSERNSTFTTLWKTIRSITARRRTPERPFASWANEVAIRR